MDHGLRVWGRPRIDGVMLLSGVYVGTGIGAVAVTVAVSVPLDMIEIEVGAKLVRIGVVVEIVVWIIALPGN